MTKPSTTMDAASTVRGFLAAKLSAVERYLGNGGGPAASFLLIGALSLAVLAARLLIGSYPRLWSKRGFTLLATSSRLPRPPPTRIVGIRIHPIKSCRGFTVQSARLQTSGFDLDRQWMFATIEADGTRKFLTIRQESRMTLIRTSLDTEKDTLVVTVRGDPSTRLEIPAHPSLEWLKQNTSLIKNAAIWADVTDGWEYHETWTAPFTSFLGKDVRLIYKGPSRRILRGNGMPELLGRTEAFAFADLSCVQVANLNSLAKLNAALRERGSEEITVERFRPNIIISGTGFEPWNEDSWKTLRISPAQDNEKLPSASQPIVLDIPARCLRCQVPNVDPETGVKNREEPWNTLMRFRNIDRGNIHKPAFGMLCVPREEGVVTVGDTLEVLEMTEEHDFMKFRKYMPA